MQIISLSARHVFVTWDNLLHLIHHNESDGGEVEGRGHEGGGDGGVRVRWEEEQEEEEAAAAAAAAAVAAASEHFILSVLTRGYKTSSTQPPPQQPSNRLNKYI